MPMDEYDRHVFIDESGDPSLETSKDGVTRHYCICAVFATNETVADQSQQAEEIRKKYFQTGEMKSSQVGSNLRRRLDVLGAISSLNVGVYCLVVDKALLNKDSGLKYKKSFIKYTHGWLLRPIFRSFSSVSVTADRHGCQKFMEGFIAYVQHNQVPSLFSGVHYRFEESALTPLLQVADFVGGSIRIAAGSDADSYAAILAAVRPLIMRLEDWPIRRIYRGTASAPASTTHDEIIQDYALRQASRFITENYSDKDPDVMLQVETLNYLLRQFTVIDSQHYTSTDELLSVLADLEPAPISPYRFRTKVIARLRDEGVIIASSPKGYKIPGTLADMHDFVSHANLIITPMVKRLALARSAISMATDRACDIVDASEYEDLRRILEAAQFGCGKEMFDSQNTTSPSEPPME
jgi:hypothetical protein